MFRNSRQVTEATRTARSYFNLSVPGVDGTTWTFWALAPFTRPGIEAVWLTNGVGFMPVGVTAAGELVNIPDAVEGSLSQLDSQRLQRSLDFEQWRIADDRLTRAMVLLSERSPGCTCARCGNRDQRAAALAAATSAQSITF